MRAAAWETCCWEANEHERNKLKTPTVLTNSLVQALPSNAILLFQQLPQLQPGNELGRSQMVLPPSAPWHLAAYTSGSRVTSWAGRTARWKHFARKQSLLHLIAFGEDLPPLPQAPSQPVAGSTSPWPRASGLH